MNGPLRKLLSIAILLGTTLFCHAIGGIWVLEVEYHIGEKDGRCFILADSWADDYEHYISNDSLFLPEFWNRFGTTGSLTVFDEIIDNEALAAAATFPMHPFQLVLSSERTLDIEKIDRITLIKVWKKIDYMVEVLSPIALKDTSWVAGPSTVTHPIGDEVGCRLEVHDLDPAHDPTALVQEFVGMYLNKDADPEGFKERTAPLLKQLKEHRVVIVELCGC